jgi:hypothetical protein
MFGNFQACFWAHTHILQFELCRVALMHVKYINDKTCPVEMKQTYCALCKT